MKKISAVALAALTAISISAKAEGDNIDYSLNIKAWSNSIHVENKDTNVTTMNAVGPLMALTARKGDYFASVTTMMPSSYTYQTTWLKRRDSDVAVGYKYNQNLSFVGGYKYVSLTDGSQTNWVEQHQGLYVGVSGFKLVGEKTFLYGNLAYLPKLKDSGTPQVDITNSSKFMSYEYGAGYALTNSTQLTLGYRTQIVKDYNVTKARSEKSTMQGLLMGVNVNF
jgi:long-subunit fatty acid transport protein